MASTYETEEPQAPDTEARAPEPERLPAGPLLLLAADEPVGVCDLDGECR